LAKGYFTPFFGPEHWRPPWGTVKLDPDSTSTKQEKERHKSSLWTETETQHKKGRRGSRSCKALWNCDNRM